MVPGSISTVVFDVGNTLHHLDHAYMAAVVSRQSHLVSPQDVAVAENAAKAAVDARLRAGIGSRDEDRRFSYFDVILGALNVNASAMEPIIAELHAEDVRQSLWRVMRPDTPQVLSALRKRGFTLAVVSNADGRVAAALRAGGLADHFTTIVDSHVVGVEKPDARIFHIALEACGAVPAKAVYVGDIYEIDVRGARNAGLAPVLLDPLGSYPDADCPRITALKDLLSLLPKTAAR